MEIARNCIYRRADNLATDCYYVCMLVYVQDCITSYPSNCSNALPVHRWNLQAPYYLSAADTDSVGLSSFASTQRAPGKAMVRYGRSRSFKVTKTGTNRKPSLRLWLHAYLLSYPTYDDLGPGLLVKNLCFFALFAVRVMLCKRGLCRHAVSVCLSVLSVKTNNSIFKFFSPPGSQSILVFPYQMSWQ